MQAYLDGVQLKSPTAGQDMIVSLKILTTGAYSDISGGTVFNFTTLPLSRPFRYSPTYIQVDSISASENHMDPTPFTQWTIQLDNPDQYDLSGLTNVRLVWRGNAYLD
jgi:hypothetical protein